MSWLSKQLKSAKKMVTHPKEWAGNALKTAGQGWEAIDDFALPAIGFALGGPAGAALGGAAAGGIGNGRPQVGNIAKGAVTGYLGGGAAAGLGGALSQGGAAIGKGAIGEGLKTIGKGGINYAMGRGAPGATGAAASMAGPGTGAAGGWGDIASQIGGAAMGSIPGVISPGMGGAPGAGGGGGGWVSDAIGGISGWLGQDGNKRKLLETLAYGIPAGMSAYQGYKAEGKQNDLLGRQMALGDQTAAIGQGLINEATPLRQTAQQQMLAALTGGAGSVPTPPDLSQFINRANPFAAQFAAGSLTPSPSPQLPTGGQAAASARSRVPRTLA